MTNSELNYQKAVDQYYEIVDHYTLKECTTAKLNELMYYSLLTVIGSY